MPEQSGRAELIAADGSRRGAAGEATPPAVTLPKGGGAVRGMGEKFAANPVTGTSSMSVPIATSPGRSGFGPQLSLSYDSSAGNGPFGFGWSLGLPQITRKTDKGLPRYRDAEDSDVFILSGAEDLVPVFKRDSQDNWVRDSNGKLLIHDDPRTIGDVLYSVRRYRPRIEGLFACIERWTNTGDANDVFWRSISKDNITTWYGKTPESRIADPANPTCIFSWLICQSYDDKGDVVVYGYKPEDSARILEDPARIVVPKTHERNRTERSRSAQRYLKRIRYGNYVPYLPELRADAPWPDPPGVGDQDGRKNWLFEVVFDYGEDAEARPHPSDDAAEPATRSISWPARNDPFSTYRASFEVRTYRLCQRVLMFHHLPDVAADPAHHVAASEGYDGLVRSTEFKYSNETSPQDARNPIYSFLLSVTQTGHKRQPAGDYLEKSLPPVEFTYSEPEVQEEVREVDRASLENLPVGLDGSTYQWTDLHGEGIPGILTEQAGAWFYKRNVSPIPEELAEGREQVKARFAPLEIVALKPNVALSGGAEFMNLAGDGQPDAVVMDGPTPGLYEHDEAEGWQPFRPFTSRLNRNLRDPNLKFVDLDGDGHADVLITEDDALIWHASLAEEGFGPAMRVAQPRDEEKGPRVVFADGTQSIYLADLSGDGLTDIVRIRNGEVCYWPNLGYGRFGAKVTMDDAPWFDHPDQFDHKRICLADIDGSGTTDIIYLHRDGVRLYFNQSGNSWSKPRPLKLFPRIDEVVSIVPIDLLGNGTACLVWSSPWPGDGRRQMRYVNLMGGQKPHLLIKTINNLGAETRVDYAPSTKFYLQDKRDGNPWITRLPFPVHVVEHVETYDHISHNRFVTRYAYHHGYFDGEEREFRGFGMVEQWDTEEFAALTGIGALSSSTNLDAASHVPPVHTKAWFHTGVYLGRERVSRHFEGEYFRELGLPVDTARPLLLDDTIVPLDLTLEEAREACRALKGSMLRQEVYADDAEHPGATPEQVQRARTPYTVTEQNFTIRTVQPRGGNRHAVFFTHSSEAISYHYERNPSDPRIQHALTLEVDAFGNVLKQAAIGYGRRRQIRVVDDQGNVKQVPNPGLTGLDATDQARQTTQLLTYTENGVTKDHDIGRDAIDRDDDYRVPLPCEALTFELTGYTASGPAIGPATIPAERIHRYQASDFVEPDPASPGRLRHKFTDQVPYEVQATGNPCRRPIEWLRTLYRRDDLSGPLPLGELQPLALPGESYKLAFTPGLLSQVYQRSGQPLLAARAAVLAVDAAAGRGAGRGGYVDLQANGHWWVPSGRVFFSPDISHTAAEELAFARSHFFLPHRHRDPFHTAAVSTESFVTYDPYDLLVHETRDALGNAVTAGERQWVLPDGTVLPEKRYNDYRVLQPALVMDPNRNRTQVAFDALGMVVATAVMGKPPPETTEGDNLVNLAADLEQAHLDQFMDAPRQASPDLNESEPTQIVRDLLQGATTRIVYDLNRFNRLGEPSFAATIARETHVSDLKIGERSNLQVSFSYADGFGREIQKKIQAEPGKVPQRDANGRIIVDADGQPTMTAKDANPRWVGSGWTIFNNKGKPVRQYEPFFTDTHHFELDVRIGVSPVLFYDPAERVVATLHPNHTYEKVVFDPWQQTTYDVNDTCAPWPAKPGDPRPPQTGDPRTDPDISGYVEEYFNALPVDPTKPWQTWHAQRINGTDQHERDAATRAAAHADTPTTAHFDTLGRAFLTVPHNRVVCAGHDLDGTEESFATRVELDIEGNQREVRDERKLPVNYLPTGALEQRIVMRYAYDMLGNRIRQLSMEAGARWMLNDVAGQPIRAWDSRGHNFSTAYDALRRPVGQYVRGTTAASDPRTLSPPTADGLLVDKIEYGEGLANAEALNLHTRIYRHFDSAGVATNARLDVTSNPLEAYDFKGNLLSSTRCLVRDYTAVPDWLLPAEPQLEAEFFAGSTLYDALNRPIQSIAPHSSLTRAQHTNKINVIQPVFNEANLLERVDVWLGRATEPPALLDPNTEALSPVGVANIDYDAKGQRLRIDYKNGATTRYGYDAETFRLLHLYTRRGAAFTEDCDNPTPPPPTIAAPDTPPEGKACGLQNLHYTYDPAGNITHIRDDAQQAVFFKNQRVEPSGDYTYDAVYRLIQATGREHLGQIGGPPIGHSWNDERRIRIDSSNGAGRFAPNDHTAMGTYTEKYVYDAVGNFGQMSHEGRGGTWTRGYAYGAASLIEGNKLNNRLRSTTLAPNAPLPQPERYAYDEHGNMIHMPHLRAGPVGTRPQNMHWDYKDQLRRADLGGGGTAYYVYDASGQRVRKVWKKKAGLIEERIYLGRFEIFREHGSTVSAAAPRLERETLHVMDDKQRIALAERRTYLRPGQTDAAPELLIRYQFGNHLGSASLELDEHAQIISYEEYAPYGSSTYQAVRSQTETAKRYRYTGKERDEESGLYYYGVRYFAPWMARWTSPDPAGLADGMNRYAYVRNNPISLFDPAGRSSRKAGREGDVNWHGNQGHRGGIDPNTGKYKLESEHVWPLSHQRESLRNPVTGKSPIPEGRGTVADRRSTTLMVREAVADAKTSGDNKALNKALAEAKAGGITPVTAAELTPEAGLSRLEKASAGTGNAVSPGANAAVIGQIDDLHANPDVRAFSRGAENSPLSNATWNEIDAAVDAPVRTGELSSLEVSQHPRANTVFKGNAEVKALKAGEEALEKGGKAILKKLGSKALKVIPFVGIGAGMYSAKAEAAQGNYGTAALEGIGLIPVVGDVVDAARLGVAIGEGGSELLGIDAVAAEYGARFENAANFVGLGKDASRTVGATGAALSSITVAPTIALQRKVMGWFQ